MNKGTSLINTLTVLRTMRKCYKAIGQHNEMRDLTERIVETKRTMALLYGAIETGRPTGKLEYKW